MLNQNKDNQYLFWNVDEALNTVDGDKDLLKDIIEIFLEDYPRIMEQVSDAIKKKDGVELERATHQLKGSVSNFSAKGTVELAACLVVKGENIDLTDSAEVFVQLQEELKHLEDELRNF
ncbi:MAG: Hpt domain-containing protein [candidate division Zixibacteria bacterium]|nr:Hpt domain-containing protein [candidate division Zixibacteria bacterium]